MFPRDKIASVETTEIGDRQEINGREQSLETDVCVCVCVCVYTHIHREKEKKMDFYQRDKFNSMGKV